MPLGLDPLGRDPRDVGAVRSGLEEPLELPDRLLVALGVDGQPVAVGRVANPAHHPELAGAGDRRLPESDVVDPALDRRPDRRFHLRLRHA